MPKFIDEITEFFTGKSAAPANPDPAINVLLLNEAKKKIETGIFTRFFKRPTIYILEIGTYIITGILIGVAVYIWKKIDNIIDAQNTIDYLNSQFSNTEYHSNNYSWISYCILFVLLLPGIIGFLMGRLFTKSRKRIKVFIEVENMIDRVIYNLKNE